MEYERRILRFDKPPEKICAEWQKHFVTEGELEASMKRPYNNFGSTMITDFPEFTSPFWNMSRREDGTSKKIDVLLGGMETICPAERPIDIEQMRETFHTITNGVC